MPPGTMLRQALIVLAAVAAAFVLAALTPVALTAPFDPRPIALGLAFVAALVLTVFLALPAFLAVRAFGRVGLRSCLIGGVCVGGIPTALLGVLGLFVADEASDGGGATVVDHMPTLHGVTQLALFVGEMAAIGLVSAFVFWLVLAACRALPAINRDYAVMPRTLPTLAFLALAAGLAALVLSLPALTKDRSCHNVLRYESSATPSLSMSLAIAGRDWPRLRRLASAYAAGHNFSFRDEGAAYHLRDLSLCTEEGTLFELEELGHEIGMVDGSTPGQAALRGEIVDITITAFVEKPNPHWRSQTQDLVSVLDRDWPGKLAFTGGDGRRIPRPSWLPPLPVK